MLLRNLKLGHALGWLKFKGWTLKVKYYFELIGIKLMRFCCTYMCLGLGHLLLFGAVHLRLYLYLRNKQLLSKLNHF